MYVDLIRTKFAETIQTTSVPQILATSCAPSFKSIKQPKKIRQSRFRKSAETTIHTESK